MAFRAFALDNPVPPKVSGALNKQDVLLEEAGAEGPAFPWALILLSIILGSMWIASFSNSQFTIHNSPQAKQQTEAAETVTTFNTYELVTIFSLAHIISWVCATFFMIAHCLSWTVITHSYYCLVPCLSEYFVRLY